MYECGSRHENANILYLYLLLNFPGDTEAEDLPANRVDTVDTSLIPESGRWPGGGNGNSLW